MLQLRIRGAPLLLALCLLLCPPPASPAVHPYANARLSPLGDAFVFRAGREGLFRSHAEEPGAASSGIANGKSYIRLSEVEFIRPKEVAARHAAAADGAVTGQITAVVFKASDRGHIGFTSPGGARRYCCSEAASPPAGCAPGSVVVTPHGDGSPWTATISFTGAREVAVAADAAVSIVHTGMYHLWFVTCDASLAGVAVEGHTAWKNPGGYLPGMMAPNLRFFGLTSLAYAALLSAWLAAVAASWRHAVALQHCIGFVLLVGFAEQATWHADYDAFNRSGFRPYGFTLAAVLLGAARKSLTRMLLLVAAQGFGVVKTQMGAELRIKVASLGAAYFVATLALDVGTHVGTVDDLRHGGRLLLVAPVATLDAAFILWTFTALSSTLGELSARKAAAKLDLYRRFTNALCAAVVASVAWIGVEMWYKLTDAHNAAWRSDWLTSAFWHVLSFAIVVAVAHTWRPGDAVDRFVAPEAAPFAASDHKSGATSGGSGGAETAADAAAAEEGAMPRATKLS